VSANPECVHEWCYAPYVLTSYPAQQDRICRKCGLAERVALGGHVDHGEFGRLKAQFARPKEG
jgi:hypothetical protein